MNRFTMGFMSATIAAAITQPEWTIREALPALVFAGIIVAIVNAALEAAWRRLARRRANRKNVPPARRGPTLEDIVNMKANLKRWNG